MILENFLYLYAFALSMGIETVQVYDPTTDGLDFAAYEALSKSNPDAALDLNYSLSFRVLNSFVYGNQNLRACRKIN